MTRHPLPNVVRAPEREGIAMLVVMLLILVVTATATFAIHSTSFELRAAGYSRTAMQSRYLATTGLQAALIQADSLGPQTICIGAQQQLSLTRVRWSGTAGPRLGAEEPPLTAEANHYEIPMDSFQRVAGIRSQPVEQTAGLESLGRSPYSPMFWLDIYDIRIVNRPIAGHQADGNGQLRYMEATYTARARIRPTSDVYSPSRAIISDPAERSRLGRGYHEIAMNARAFGRAGPFGGCQ